MPDASHARLQGSIVDRAQNQFAAVNAGLVRKTRGLLDRIVGDAALQPRLLNTLSMLEHMGSHRIMATQRGALAGQATLRHLAEEGSSTTCLPVSRDRASTIRRASVVPATCRIAMNAMPPSSPTS